MQVNRSQSPSSLHEALNSTGRASVGRMARGQDDAKNRQKTAQNSVRLPQYERLQNWAVMGLAQQKVTEAQSSEQALLQAYRQLKQIERQLKQHQQVGQQVRDQLEQLDDELTGSEGPLTRTLRPKVLSRHREQASYVLDKVDLLSARPTTERLQLFFPSSAETVQVTVPADSSGQQTLARLQSGLKSAGVRLSQGADGQVEFHVNPDDRRKLDEAVFFTGEGIRVPAGNPVAIKLSPVKSELAQLGEGLSRGETKQQQAKMQSLLGTIEQSMRDLQKFRRQMLIQLDKVRARSAEISEQHLADLLQEMQQQLVQGDFGSTYRGLVTQANVSRQDVVALLSGSGS